jgi:hypothetical protein
MRQDGCSGKAYYIAMTAIAMIASIGGVDRIAIYFLPGLVPGKVWARGVETQPTLSAARLRRT